MHRNKNNFMMGKLSEARVVSIESPGKSIPNEPLVDTNREVVRMIWSRLLTARLEIMRCNQ